MLQLSWTSLDAIHHPLTTVPTAAEWRRLLLWTHTNLPQDPRPGRPRNPAWGSAPEWLEPLAPDLLWIPRWTVTWDPEIGPIGTRWLPMPRERAMDKMWQVVVGPDEWTGVWTVRLWPPSRPNVWALWWPDWQRAIAVVLMDRADPDPYGPHPPIIQERVVAPADQRDRWAEFLVTERQWVTLAEWQFWAHPTAQARQSAITQWPVVFWA